MVGVNRPEGEGFVDGIGARFRLRDILKDNEKLEHFKSLIRFDDRIDPACRSHEILLETVNGNMKELLQYLATDYFVFQNGFAGDLKLFGDSYWNYFLQMCHKYDMDKGRVINERSFVIFLARWLFVVKLYDKQKEDGEHGQGVKIFWPYDETVSGLWVKHVADTLRFVNVLTDHLENIGVIEDMLAESSRFLHDFAREVPQDNMESVVKYVQEIKQKRDVSLDSISKGEVLCCDLKSTPGFEWVTYLGGSILSAVNKLNESGYDDLFPARVVRRRDDGGMEKEANMMPIMADPLGGVFVYANGVRNDYFKIRMAYLFSLWDMAMKDKAAQILESV